MNLHPRPMQYSMATHMYNCVISRMAIIPKGAKLRCLTTLCLVNKVSPAAYHMDHPHSATCLFKLSSHSPNNLICISTEMRYPDSSVTWFYFPPLFFCYYGRVSYFSIRIKLISVTEDTKTNSKPIEEMIGQSFVETRQER